MLLLGLRRSGGAAAAAAANSLQRLGAPLHTNPSAMRVGGAREKVLARIRSVQEKKGFQTINKTPRDSDMLVVGCGIAGASAALKAASMGLQVTMLTSAMDPLDCNSYWAQGGIIYKAKDDHPSLLADDVCTAGAGICDSDAVMKLALDGPGRVEEMLLGMAKVPFDRTPEGELALCLEASHNRARIIHWRDQTGRAITECVQAAAATHPNIRLVRGATAVDLALAYGGSAAASRSGPNGYGGVQCVGAHVLVQEEEGAKARLETMLASSTVLATGGLGDLYEYTSNPASARGDGFAMALRAGAALRNMEYVQFHPTTLPVEGDRSFLLTEALRGEGAILRDSDGRAFAKDYHPQGELAPRDVVSRMIVSEMDARREPYMFLDISHRDEDWIRRRFPGVYKHALACGYDITAGPVPIQPAAHYFCGGVMTDLSGQTTLPGLLAAGEVACTGLHGGNRLASTSLLEGVVWGCSLAEHLTSPVESGTNVTNLEALSASAGNASLIPHDHRGLGLPDADPEGLEAAWKLLRRTMTDKVGVVRTERSLREALETLDKLHAQAKAIYGQTRLSPHTSALRNATDTAGMIAQAAAANPESVGTHYLEPEEDESFGEEDESMLAA